jgi:hypothetical protein
VQRRAAAAAAIAEVPAAQMYEKSFMHRDAVTYVAVGAHGFILTGSADGDLRFWRKTPVRCRFVSMQLLCVHALAPMQLLIMAADRTGIVDAVLGRMLALSESLHMAVTER